MPSGTKEQILELVDGAVRAGAAHGWACSLGVEGAYQRSDLLAARTEVMERWGRYVSSKGA